MVQLLRFTEGGLSYTELKNMSLTEYMMILHAVETIQKEEEEEIEKAEKKAKSKARSYKRGI